jgi:hypothetical protein
MQDEYLRVLTAQLHVMLLWTISRERFGKSYAALTAQESQEIDNAAYGQTRYFASLLTPEKVKEMCSPLPPEATIPTGGKIH